MFTSIEDVTHVTHVKEGIYTLWASHIPENYRVLGTMSYNACYNCGVLGYWVSCAMKSTGIEVVDGGFRVGEFMP